MRTHQPKQPTLSERELFSLTYGMSEMAAKHKSDIISNALAALSHKLTNIGPAVKPADLDDIDRFALRYFHQHRGEFQIMNDIRRPRERQRDAGFHSKKG